MLWILLIVVLGVVAYRYRVKILARVLGQPEGRIERQIGRKKRSGHLVVDGVRRGVGAAP